MDEEQITELTILQKVMEAAALSPEEAAASGTETVEAESQWHDPRADAEAEACSVLDANIHLHWVGSEEGTVLKVRSIPAAFFEIQLA